MNENLKQKLYEIIFEADTKPGKAFDIALLIVILFSIFIVILESVPRYESGYGDILKAIEWIVTIIFTMEYLLRIMVVRKPLSYILSFYGIVDLLAVIPTYLGLILAGTQGLVVIRALRLLRVFRIMKLSRYTTEGSTIIRALKASREKISVFIFTVFTLVIIIGTVMYLIEGAPSGFTSIPKGIYWAIVTMTTVGYGDIAPVTNVGQFIASLVMILGYAIIAVPTGIVTVEFAREKQRVKRSVRCCSNCLKEDHEEDAVFCRYCGERLT
ncbi:MAG: ion transporter [Bacteroidales bacterium]|nr:MAG: ion transporter [Bacteroidales bacterium]